MTLLDKYINYIQEGYITSDKTISVNLHKFESGKKNKLLVMGVAGSGKTTIGEMLAKKYKVKWISIDSLWWRLEQKYFKGVDMSLQKYKDKLQDKFEKEVFKYLKSNERLIIEGINLMENKYRKDIFKHSMIILGLSSLRAGIRAGLRNIEREGGEGWRELYWMSKLNMKTIEPKVKVIRRHITMIPNVVIEEYKLPKK